jgi:hypothetical protein
VEKMKIPFISLPPSEYCLRIGVELRAQSKWEYAMTIKALIPHKHAESGEPGPKFWAEAPPWQFAEFIRTLRCTFGPLVITEVDWAALNPDVVKTMH